MTDGADVKHFWAAVFCDILSLVPRHSPLCLIPISYLSGVCAAPWRLRNNNEISKLTAVSNQFLGLAVAGGLTLALGPTAAAQVTDLTSYQGPGILSPGVGDIGTRSGQQVDLRYYGGVSGFYDTNPQPVSVDPQGNLIKAPDLYGYALNFGVYGSHSFRLSQLSLDYRGDYLETNISTYNTSDHSLRLGFTYQATRRLVFDFREAVGTLKYGYGTVASGATGDATAALSTSSLFFDDRTYFGQSSASMTFLASARTSFTVSGSAFLQDYNSGEGLSNSWGYSASGSVNRRLSMNTSLGALYQHSQFQVPSLGSQSTSDAYFGTFATRLGRFWTFSLQAGVAIVQTQSPFTLALSPVLAAILGQNTISGIAFVRNIYPSGIVDLQRKFQHASIDFQYNRRIIAGNGSSSTSRTEDGRVTAGYTGLRRINVYASGGFNYLVALGQSTYKFEQYTAGVGISYNLGRDLHATARFDYRDQEIVPSGYLLRGSRSSLGLMFSPGKTPLSLW
jgi:hypothetical protein